MLELVGIILIQMLEGSSSILSDSAFADPLPGHAGDTVDARLPNHLTHRVRASHLFDDAELLQVCQGRVHGRRGEASVFNKRPLGRKWIALEPIMNAQCGPGTIALRCNPFTAALEEGGNLPSSIECLARRLGHADKEELQPGFPSTSLAHLLQKPIAVGVMRFSDGSYRAGCWYRLL
jgi:hypothetical protein